ncbi:hypothetical protein C360_03764 [Cryptococcus neoformans Bt15]|nr:hypothetical protein C360_03764 [Cryptococcus neoformans var. grubii Bt15]
MSVPTAALQHQFSPANVVLCIGINPTICQKRRRGRTQQW